MSKIMENGLGKEIGISVKEALELESLKDAKLLAGSKGLGNIITSVNVMEVPDIVDWVGAGEMIITTAYAIKNDVTALLSLIPVLKEKGVAALGIKPLRYIGKIPEDVIELASSLAFPLFEIESNIGFSVIITEVLGGILDNKTKVLKHVQQLNKALVQTMLHSGNLQQICQILYDEFGNSVAIISDYFSSAVMSTAEENEADISAILMEEKTGRFRGGAQSKPNYTYRVDGDKLGGKTYKRIVIPIISDNIDYGKIYMWEDCMEMTEVHISVVESVTILIALELVKRASMRELENSHKLVFVQRLLSHDQKEHQKVAQTAHYFDIDLTVAHRVMVLKAKNRSDGSLIPSDVKYRINNIIMGILQYLGAATALKMLFVVEGDRVILVCEYSANMKMDYDKVIGNFKKELMEQMHQSGLASLVSVGVGRTYHQVSQLYKSFEEAKRAEYYSGFVKDSFVLFEDMGLYRLLLLQNQLDEELRIFCEEMLLPLFQYDKEKDSELIKTLKTYFYCCGNMTQLSKELGIHYNTVVYRLQKMTELTGLDFGKEENLLNLQIALKISELTQNE